MNFRMPPLQPMQWPAPGQMQVRGMPSGWPAQSGMGLWQGNAMNPASSFPMFGIPGQMNVNPALMTNRVQSARQPVDSPSMIANVANGLRNGLTQAANYVKEHPFKSAAIGGGAVAAAAVCPYLAGAGLAAAGVGAANQMLNKGSFS